MLCVCLCSYFFFFFKQKTAYEMRISDWSSDVCSSDLSSRRANRSRRHRLPPLPSALPLDRRGIQRACGLPRPFHIADWRCSRLAHRGAFPAAGPVRPVLPPFLRSEEHTSELQSLMRISYAVFCLKKKKKSYNSSTR